MMDPRKDEMLCLKKERKVRRFAARIVCSLALPDGFGSVWLGRTSGAGVQVPWPRSDSKKKKMVPWQKCSQKAINVLTCIRFT